jgi:hypothetical protein
MTPALRRFWIAPLLALALAGCDSPFGYDDDIEGYYAYAGTVDDSPGYSVNGELRITRQHGDRAEGRMDWYMYEGSRRVLEITSNNVDVHIERDGDVRFDVYGDLQLSSGRWTTFELRHEGRLRGRTLRGSWDLRTDMPSTDEGRFTASR